MTDFLVPTPPGPQRRLVLGGIATAAVVAGLGVGLWRRGSAPALTEQEKALWDLRLTSPDGAPLAMAGFKGKPLVVNFWATWCPPCVEELPLLDRFYRENTAKGWQVVGLAIDQPSAVRNFLQKTPVSFALGMAGLGGTDLVKSLGNSTGGLPFTVVFGPGGGVLHRKMGQLSSTDLQLWTSLA